MGALLTLGRACPSQDKLIPVIANDLPENTSLIGKQTNPELMAPITSFIKLSHTNSTFSLPYFTPGPCTRELRTIPPAQSLLKFSKLFSPKLLQLTHPALLILFCKHHNKGSPVSFCLLTDWCFPRCPLLLGTIGAAPRQRSDLFSSL